MINVVPIPKHLLIHTVEYQEYDADGPFQDGYKAPVKIENVRMEPSNELITNSNGESITSNATLFIDAVNSSPIITLVEKSKIIFNGQDFYVHKVDALYTTNSNPHHWEVAL